VEVAISVGLWRLSTRVKRLADLVTSEVNCLFPESVELLELELDCLARVLDPVSRG